jgi:hypothetical protein
MVSGCLEETFSVSGEETGPLSLRGPFPFSKELRRFTLPCNALFAIPNDLFRAECQETTNVAF